MKRFFSILAATLLASAFSMSVAIADDTPFEENWWPSQWGADDTAGSVNLVSPENTERALSVVSEYKTATLGKIYEADAPFFGARGWNMTIPGLPTGGPFGPMEMTYNDEMLTTEIGQVGTQFDGPGHIGVQTSRGVMHYNGRDLHEVGGTYGLGPLGVDQVAEKGFICRGVLLDAVKHTGMNPVPVPSGDPPRDDEPGVITADDVKAMVQSQGIDPIGKGDCVFVYTGHGNTYWPDQKWAGMSAEQKRKNVAKFNSGEPGYGVSACQYFADRNIMLTGGDTWAVEAVPNRNAQPFECHMRLQTGHGIWNLENLRLKPLADQGVYEFAFIWSPLKMRGATGSPGNPIAIW